MIYENEVGFWPLAKQELPEGMLEQFAVDNADYEYISLLQWEEHCTECAMPACYQSCDLYAPRKDGKCRRFKNGIGLYRLKNNHNLTVACVEFKKWGALMATGPIDLIHKNEAATIESKLDLASKVATVVPDAKISIFGRSGISSRLATRYKNYTIQKTIDSLAVDLEADYFIVQLYNPSNAEADITFTVRATNDSMGKFPYQKRMIIAKGYYHAKIPFEEMKPFLDIHKDHYVSFTPNNSDSSNVPLSLFFGQIGFVKSKAKSTKSKRKMVKVIAWDLDNTIWDGTLTETEGGAVILKDKIKLIMESLDKRGIVNTVVSKNDHEIAMAKLKEFDLDDLVVFPKISWLPKSEAIRELAADFNIGIDTIAFIDDSEFERTEVSQTVPNARVYDALEYKEILDKEEFNPKTSSESAGRRKFYQSQEIRTSEKNNFSGDYLNFVKSCEMKVFISRVHANSVDRANELVQRTNQLNFSGNRYDRENLLNLISNERIDAFGIECKDKFGDYGTVGFCMVDLDELNMVDLMFSCRVQSKRVEHAFLHWLLEHYKKLGFKSFSATYNQTDKNTPSGTVFKDMQFYKSTVKDSRINYAFDLNAEILNDNIVEVIETL